MDETVAERAFSLGAGEGEALWWLGSLTTIKATSEQTEGRYSLVEVLEPRGVEAPLHVHHREDEGFWVLEGEVTFRIGEEEIPAGPGSFVFGPRGVPHSYRVDSETARLLFILSPGGMEGFIRASSEPAASLTIPPSDGVYDESEMEGLVALAREYGAEILG
jgi:mannose-6-phosphate isomerase-like protein (cupin superfamily)